MFSKLMFNFKNYGNYTAMFLIVVALCASVKTASALEMEFEKTSATETIDNAASAHSEINVLRREDPVNIDQIESLYVSNIQALVQEVDTANELTLDADIVQAIDDIRNSVDVPLAAQVIDKTIRRVFFIIALANANDVKNEFNSLGADELNGLWDKGFAAFDAIDGTINQSAYNISEDGLSLVDIGNAGLADNVTRAFINGQNAINKDSDDSDEGADDGDLTRIKVQRQIVRFTMERGMYLIVLKEVKAAMERIADDPDGAAVAQKEAILFHKAIAAKVSRDNEEGNAVIEAQLAGPIEDYVVETLIKEYSKAWCNGTERELDGNSGAMGSGDIQKAIETAHEGILFAEMMIDDLEQRLGKESRDVVTKAFGDLKLASANGFASDALEQREIVREILDEYEEKLSN